MFRVPRNKNKRNRGEETRKRKGKLEEGMKGTKATTTRPIINSEVCAECSSGEGEVEEWIGCESCLNWYHMLCAGDPNLVDMEF